MAYVKNDALMQALLASHAQGKLTAECYTMFEQIVDQRIRKLFQHSLEAHYDVCFDWCIDKVTRIWHSFKFENDNAFAYFVSVIDNTIKLYFLKNDIFIVNIDAVNQKFADS